MKLHVPVEQYGFVEVELPKDTTPEEVKLAYDEIKAEFSANYGEGITPKEFNEQLDRYLSENTLNADMYTNMSKAQQYVIQECKKSFKRIKAKDE